MGQGPEYLSVQQASEGPGGPGEAQDIRASAWMRDVNEVPVMQTASARQGERRGGGNSGGPLLRVPVDAASVNYQPAPGRLASGSAPRLELKTRCGWTCG